MSKLAFVASAAVAALAAARAPASAQSRTVLRVATVAPDGTSWARAIRAFAGEVEAASSGTVAVKVYWGAIAGDDSQSAERVERGQLDGVFSGGILCEHKAPSLRALRLVGLYQSRAEADHVLGVLRPVVDEELRRAGLVMLTIGNLGPSDVFSRRPIRTLADLKRDPLWQWDTDDVQRAILTRMGLKLVPLPLTEATRAYAEQRSDGFLSIPSAVLAFQWSVQAKYFSDLQLSYLMGCFVLSQRAFDKLPVAQQEQVRAAGARLGARMMAIAREQDDALVHGLFQHQGLVTVPVSSELRDEFFAAARAARDSLGEQLVPAPLMARVRAALDEYRAHHPPP
jgi:TRAP-type C4-dicarboxylate transport system substrate-binding protein